MKAHSSLLLILAFLLCACQPAAPSPIPTAVNTFGFTADEFAMLNSLEKLDKHPLYVMHYVGDYSGAPSAGRLPQTARDADECSPAWGCSLFAALGDADARLYGRNFDWRFSPALLLFTDPSDGYASVSMVDIEYLGFDEENAGGLLDAPFERRAALLDAPSLPFDGMNEKGLAIGMAAVPPGDHVPSDSGKQTIDQLMVIREVLDHAATVDEAVYILGRYNIDMGNVPIHYLIASASGESALVEFYRNELRVFRNEAMWQVATNFHFAATDGNAGGMCHRYDRVQARLHESGGRLNMAEALRLLADVSQGGESGTQWSIVYNMTSGEVRIVMERNYSGEVHSIQLEQVRP